MQKASLPLYNNFIFSSCQKHTAEIRVCWSKHSLRNNNGT